MPLRLLTGSPGTLDLAITREVAKARERDPLSPMTILVGGTLLRPYLRRRLAELGGGHVNVHISLPGELGLRLAEHRMRREGRRPLSALADRALVHEVARGADGYFAPVSAAPGFAEVLGRLFRELRAAGLEAADFAAGAAGERKREDLAGLYAAYLQARSEVYDGQDCLQALRAEDALDAAVIVHGIWQMPLTLRQALERLSERVEVTVVLPRQDPETDAAHGALREWLERCRAAEERCAEVGQPAGALGHLQARLFVRPPRAADADESVVLVSAPDPNREAREAVRTCLQWVGEGIPAYEIAIVARNPEAYRPFIDSACREAGVEVYVHAGTPLAERPLGRQALRLLELIGSDLPRGPLMELLSEMRLPQETWERLGGMLPSSWDQISRRAGVIGGLESWREQLAAVIAQEREKAAAGDEWAAEQAARAETLLAFVEQLAARFDERPQRATWSEHVRYLAGLLEEYVDGSRPLAEQLSTLCELDGLAGTIGFERFKETAAAAIEGLRVEDVSEQRPAAFARRGLNLLDVASLRHLSFRGVAVLGLTERAFPPPVRQDPLLLDGEREALCAQNGWELPLRTHGADPEPLQFLLAVCAGRERLALSFARAEESGGRAKLPSSFFRAAAEALTGARVRTDEVDAIDERLYTRVPAGRIGAGVPERALSAEDRDRTLLERDRRLGTAVIERRRPAFARGRRLVRERRWSERLTPYDGLLSSAECADLLAERWGEGRAFSPTSLEGYAACPYRFFLGRVLGAAVEPEPEEVERISALDRGSLMHEVFETFLRGLGEERPSRAAHAAHLARLEEIARGVCDEYERAGLTGHALLWAHDREEILADLRLWLETEEAEAEQSRFAQASFEVPFGLDEEEAEPVAIPVEGGRLLVKGRIDRLEYDPGRRFRVIDYKTGSSKSRPQENSVNGGRALQLPIYMLVAGEKLGIPAEQGSASYFYASRRGRFRRAAFAGEALGTGEQSVGALLAELTAGLRSGDFHATPDKDACRYCDFKGVCDASRRAAYELKAGDDLVQRLAALRERHP